MASENLVTLTGNLTEDPELKFTPSGVPLCNFSMAVNKRWKDRNDEWQEETSFFRGSAWRDLAENISESVRRGDRVTVVGRLQQRTWETQDGDKRSMIEISVDEFAVNLRWAQAKPQKVNTSGGGGGGYSAPPPTPRDNYGPDEAPF